MSNMVKGNRGSRLSKVARKGMEQVSDLSDDLSSAYQTVLPGFFSRNNIVSEEYGEVTRLIFSLKRALESLQYAANQMPELTDDERDSFERQLARRRR